MSSYHPEEPDLNIWPLTFLQVYQSADTVMAALSEKDVTFRKLASSEGLRQFGRYVIFPIYYHLLTSGYGAMVDNNLVGWVYVRGWDQVLYIETLATHPDWRHKGVGTSLLHFAEEQAHILNRDWVALTVTAANAPAVAFYEKAGYQRGHWRVFERPTGLVLDEPMPASVRLHPVLGPAAEIAYRTYSGQDERAGDGWASEAIVRLSSYDPYRQLGGEWVVEADGKTAGYLNIHQADGRMVIYLSTGPDWWGSLELIKAALLTFQPVERPLPVCIRLGSSGHHDTAREIITSLGFEEQPAATMRLFKKLSKEQ